MVSQLSQFSPKEGCLVLICGFQVGKRNILALIFANRILSDYVGQGAILLYEVLRGVGDFVWGSGIFCAFLQWILKMIMPIIIENSSFNCILIIIVI